MNEANPVHVRRTIYYTGNVQGVGFRYTAYALASGFRVTGFVRNLSDGRVEVVAQGAPDEVERFEHAVSEAMRSNIVDTASSQSPATDKLSRFTIAD